jgi:hypothetical protein
MFIICEARVLERVTLHRGRAWNPALHFALQHAEKADERREKRAVARTTAVASSTSRSVSTVAAGTVPTGVAETSESARTPAFPDLPEVRGTSVVGSDWTRRDDTSFSSETLRVTIQGASKRFLLFETFRVEIYYYEFLMLDTFD